MVLISKLSSVLRWALLLWGGTRIREYIWNREFSGGRWTCLEDTAGDCVYRLVEKYSNGGSILDLGCGSGNTGEELDSSKYEAYTGVDVSGVAIRTARERAKASGRDKQNRYYQSDILKYVPHDKYHVILLRDSIYYLPTAKAKLLLDRYSVYLEDKGVFVVRLYDKDNAKQYVDLIQSNYKLVERDWPTTTKTGVLVFR